MIYEKGGYSKSGPGVKKNIDGAVPSGTILGIGSIGGVLPSETGLFISSINGDDSFDGLSRNSPKATLPAISPLIEDGVSVFLERGSHWNGPDSDLRIQNANVTVKTYGAGEKPIITGAEVCDTITKTGGYTNIYQSTHNFGNGIADLTYGRMMIFEDGVVLQPRESMAEVDANEGTYFYDTSTYPDNYDNGSYAVYFHPTGSTNPTSDGKTYFVNKYAGLRTVGTNSALGLTIEDVVQAYTWGATQFLLESDNVTARRCISLYGGKHNFHFGNNNLSEDCIAYGAQDLKNVDFGGSMYVTYTQEADNGKELIGSYIRCLAIKQNDSIKAGGWISHSNIPGLNPICTFSDCNSEGIPAPGGIIIGGHHTKESSVPQNLTSIKDAFIEMVESATNDAYNDSGEISIENSLINKGSAHALANAILTDISVQNSFIVPNAGFTGPYLPQNDSVARTISIKNSVILEFSRQGGSNDNTEIDNDYNLLMHWQLINPQFRVNGSTYTFLQWIDFHANEERSSDENTVFVKAPQSKSDIFKFNLETGKVEINSELPVWGKSPTTGLITQYIGTFPDGTPLGDKIPPRSFTQYDFDSVKTTMNTLVSSISSSIAAM